MNKFCDSIPITIGTIKNIKLYTDEMSMSTSSQQPQMNIRTFHPDSYRDN
jgi:hypothetical protein